MNNERVLPILRNIRLLIEQLKIEIDTNYYFEHSLIKSIESCVRCIESLVEKNK